MKNILVTGGCGFIGTNFIHYVLRQTDFDGQIVNLDCLTYAGNAYNHDDVHEGYTFVHGSICDAELVGRVCDDYAIDTIVHFAAESHVDRSIQAPNLFLETNVFGTFTLLEAAKQRPRISRFHHISTDEVYGSLGDDGLFTEDTPYHPNNPYSASKAASDHLVQAYANTFRIPVTISNCSNNYGPFQFPEKLIPLTILNAIEGKPIPVYGKGRNIRDWLYVKDHCRAIWQILLHGKLGETYNVGGGADLTNLTVVESICDTLQDLLPPAAVERYHDLITFVPDRPGHDWRYAIDASKIHEELNWSPKEDFATGLLKTVNWYLTHDAWINQVRTGAYREWIQTHYTAKTQPSVSYESD